MRVFISATRSSRLQTSLVTDHSRGDSFRVLLVCCSLIYSTMDATRSSRLQISLVNDHSRGDSFRTLLECCLIYSMMDSFSLSKQPGHHFVLTGPPVRARCSPAEHDTKVIRRGGGGGGRLGGGIKKRT